MKLQRNKGYIVAVLRNAARSFTDHFYLAYAVSTNVHAGKSVMNKIDVLFPHGT